MCLFVYFFNQIEETNHDHENYVFDKNNLRYFWIYRIIRVQIDKYLACKKTSRILNSMFFFFVSANISFLFHFPVISLTVVLIIISHQANKTEGGKTGWSHDLAGVCFIPVTCLVVILFLERYSQDNNHLCCKPLNFLGDNITV